MMNTLARRPRLLGRPLWLTTGTSVLAVTAIGAAALLPRDASVPDRDLGAVTLLSESTAMAKAQALDEPVEVTSLTTETVLVTALPEGRFRAEINVMPVRVRDADGGWHPVDNTLIRRDDGSIGPAMPAVPMSFSGGGSVGPLARIADGDRSMAISWPAVGELPEPELTGTIAKYSSVLPGIDLVAQAGPTGFSTFVVIQDATAAQNPAVQKLVFDVDVDGVRVREDSTGGMTALDGTEAVFNASQPMAWDSRGGAATVEPAFTEEEEAVDAPLSAPVKAGSEEMELEATNEQMTVDSGAFLDESTVYPAVLDPSVDKNGAKAWTMVWSNGTTIYDHATEHARVGYDGWSATADRKISRSYFTMDMPTTLRGKMVDTAILAHKLIHSPNSSCSAATFGPLVQVYRTKAFSSSTKWSAQPDRIGSVQDEDATANGHESTCGGSTRQEWNVKTAIVDATTEVKDEVYFMLKSKDEADKNGWRKYDNTDSYPSLTVEYYAYPPNPTSVSVSPLKTTPAFGSWTSTTRPIFSAPGISDPNGGSAYARFQLIDNSVITWDAVSSGGAAGGHTATIQLPAGKTANGEDYRIRVYSAADDQGKFHSAGYAEFTFGVDTTLPPPPTVSQNGDCTVGTNCSFAFTSSADATDYHYGMNTDTTPTKHTPASAGAALTTPIYAPVFGPSWITAKTEDRAGNKSVARVLNFTVLSKSMSHRWAMDGSAAAQAGTDSGTPGGTALAFPLGWLPTPGPFTSPQSGPLDPADTAFALGGNRYGTATSPSSATLSNFFTNDDFSVAAWVKVPTGSGEQTALSLAGAQGSVFSLGYNNGSWVFTVSGADANGAPTTVVASAPVRPDAGEWVHLTGVYNNESLEPLQPGEPPRVRNITLYVNGRPAAVTPAPLVYGATGPLFIGRNAIGSTSYLSTAIDEVRVFPGIIDDSQVLRIASERRPY